MYYKLDTKMKNDLSHTFISVSWADCVTSIWTTWRDGQSLHIIDSFLCSSLLMVSGRSAASLKICWLLFMVTGLISLLMFDSTNQLCPHSITQRRGKRPKWGVHAAAEHISTMNYSFIHESLSCLPPLCCSPSLNVFQLSRFPECKGHCISFLVTCLLNS